MAIQTVPAPDAAPASPWERLRRLSPTLRAVVLAYIADIVLFIVSLPPHINISEVWVRATADVSY